MCVCAWVSESVSERKDLLQHCRSGGDFGGGNGGTQCDGSKRVRGGLPEQERYSIQEQQCQRKSLCIVEIAAEI